MFLFWSVATNRSQQCLFWINLVEKLVFIVLVSFQNVNIHIHKTFTYGLWRALPGSCVIIFVPKEDLYA